MPELPEVETIRRGLERSIKGRKICHVELFEKRSCTVSKASLVAMITDAKIRGVRRRGKLLIVDLSNGISMLIHLRMTGQLIFKAQDTIHEYPQLDVLWAHSDTEDYPSGAILLSHPELELLADISANFGGGQDTDFGGGYPNKSFAGKLPDKTTRAIITFEDGSHLYFNDQRKFGYIKPVPTGKVTDDSFVASLGPEPLDDKFELPNFIARLPKSSKRCIKAVLLDQSIVAGIGNIYADESLFLAGIRPDRPVCSLTEAEMKKLYISLRACMELSIEAGGSTMKDYVDSEGLRGEYLDLYACVFNRAGLPCKACGTAIEKTKVAGRGTHYCPRCQN